MLRRPRTDRTFQYLLNIRPDDCRRGWRGQVVHHQPVPGLSAAANRRPQVHQHRHRDPVRRQQARKVRDDLSYLHVSWQT